MESLAESMPGQAAMPRFEDGSVNLRELMRRLAEDVVNAIMDAEAEPDALAYLASRLPIGSGCARTTCRSGPTAR